MIDSHEYELCSDHEKANGLADYYQSVSDVCKDLSTKTFKNKVHSTVKKFFKNNIILNDIKFVTYNEVVVNIKTLKNKKSTGDDLVSAKMLKNSS